MNLKFVCAYDGSLFQGSQKQPNKNTIEDELLKAFKTLNIQTSIVLSGRTDKEVHATGQVFNCIIPDFWRDFFKLQEILNKRLPSSIQIRHIVKVDENFHSRFHAKKRVYRYLITTKPTTPFNDKFITYVKSVDEKLLKEASEKVSEFL